MTRPSQGSGRAQRTASVMVVTVLSAPGAAGACRQAAGRPLSAGDAQPGGWGLAARARAALTGAP
eukprot:5056469-Lingulodinium_polyedra.AAC.1